jgi:putative PIN family toxin of toxin-antitoxin system
VRVVLDTNVLVSGFSTPLGVPGQLLTRWLGGEYTLVMSTAILNELEDVLNRTYFASRFAAATRQAIIELVQNNGEFVQITGSIPQVVADIADNLVLETAVQGSADYLVTGDGLLLTQAVYQEVQIVAPRQFLTLLDAT